MSLDGTNEIGHLPCEQIAKVSRRLLARQYGVTEISLQGTHIRLGPVDLPESRQMRLRRLYPKAVYKQAVRTISVPRPTEGDRMGSPQLRDRELMNWVRNLLDGVLGPM